MNDIEIRCDRKFNNENTVWFCNFDKFFTRMDFVVSNEIISNDFVDRFWKTKFNHNNYLFRFLKKDFFQLIHIINFFDDQRRNAKNVCCYQNFRDFLFFDVVVKINVFDSNEMHQNLIKFDLHSCFRIKKTCSFDLLTKNFFVVFFREKQ